VLAQRVATAVVGIPALVVVLFLGQWWIAALILVVALLAGLETFRLLGQAGYPSLAWLGTAIGLVLVIAGILFTDTHEKAFLFLVAGFMLAAIGSFLRADPRDGLATLMATLFGGLYVGLLGFLPRLAGLDLALAPGAQVSGLLDAGRWWLVLAVLGVWAYDTGAYFAGRVIGGPRFLKPISPSKTWAGAVGGLITATAVVAILLWALGRGPVEALVLGPLVSIAAQAGDLLESMIKRAAGAKDSGRLFPGHGGILDRVDSLLFAGPVVYFYVLAVVR
jgi:phosphatidate cytidylyltransferase